MSFGIENIGVQKMEVCVRIKEVFSEIKLDSPH